MSEWRIEYGNDTGPHDDYFYEWWTVTNGKMSFKADNEMSANWILEVLTEYTKVPKCEMFDIDNLEAVRGMK